MQTPIVDPPTTDPLLRVEGLGVAVRRRQGALPILEDVTFDLAGDETLAIVGESGSGKSMLALAITRLLTPPDTYAVSGRVRFRAPTSCNCRPRACARCAAAAWPSSSRRR